MKTTDKITFKKFHRNYKYSNLIPGGYDIWHVYINNKRQEGYSIKSDVLNEFILLKYGGFFLGPYKSQTQNIIFFWKEQQQYCIFQNLSDAKRTILEYISQGY